MSLDNASSKIVEEIGDIFQDNEKTLPSIAKEILKQVLKKRQSHPRVQGSLNASSKCFEKKREEEPKGFFNPLERIRCLYKSSSLNPLERIRCLYKSSSPYR